MSLMTVLFMGGLMISSVGFSVWCFRHLTKERWQMMAVIPLRKREDGCWDGLNLTYYGLFNGIAFTGAAALAFILLASVRVSPAMAIAILAILIAICAPASSIVARWVEGKKHTLTVGGAAFVGIVLAPWLIVAAELLRQRAGLAAEVSAWPVLAALAITYAFGEGLGRLACISFGCCYGRPLSSLPPRWQVWLDRLSFRFRGHTRKIAYASGLAHQPVLPVQAITNLLYLAASFAGTGLFLSGRYYLACVVPLAVTQLWRIGSEFLRADYRGNATFSAYQRMSVISLLYMAMLPLLLPVIPVDPPSLTDGLHALLSLPVLLLLQGLFIFAFVYTGCSSVTGSVVAFNVKSDRI
ncbi:MAG TPA: prolipoprotein diacylglyceryl transferase [Verrucomicrobia bacterium]|nr:prolipoprotein diacylglyceryl transferase [Verrucomicrobiota bacterium]